MKSDRLFVVSLKQTLASEIDSECCCRSPANICVSNALKLLFDLLYFLCVSPFRLVLDKNTPSFLIRTYLPQKLLCAITFVIYTIQHCSLLRFDYPKNAKSPSDIFSFFDSVLFTLYRFNFLKVIWLNQEQVQNVANFILQANFSFVSSLAHKIFFNKHFQNFLLSIHVAMVLFDYISGRGLFPSPFHLNELSFEKWTNRMLKKTKLVLFLASSNRISDAYENQPVWGAYDYFLFLFGSLSHLYSRINLVFSEYYLYIMSAILWCCTSSFAKYTRYSCNSWASLKQHYKILHSLATHINDSISFLAFWWLTGSIFFFSLNIDIFFPNNTTTGAVQLHNVFITLYWLVAGFLFTLACGQAGSNVSQFPSSLLNYHEYLLIILKRYRCKLSKPGCTERTSLKKCQLAS